jgi:hypothetical protein
MKELWDIRRSVRTLEEVIVNIRYRETTNEDKEVFMGAAVSM